MTNIKKLPTVSVCMITYNHEKYIAEAIEGVLKQKGGFDLRLYIGEDRSSDGTRAICERYAERHPEIITLLPSDQRYGMMGNFIRTLKECNGEYLALCDGDDYWTDASKLDKQVSLLEDNFDLTICFHRVNFLFPNGTIQEEEKKPLTEETYTILDLANKNFIHTASVVYRNTFFENLPTWFSESSVGDYVLHMLNAKHGKIKYLPICMAVYRVHEQGVWSQLQVEKVRPKWISLLDNLMRENFSHEVREILGKQKVSAVESYLRFLLANDIEMFKTNLQKYLNEGAIDKDKWLLHYLPKRIESLEAKISEVRNSWLFKAYKKLNNFKFKRL